METIKNRIIKTELVDIDRLTPFQGTLKTMDDARFNKLRKSILDEGFSFTVHVWENADVIYIIDGHQRVSVLTQMRKQGYEVPPINCAFVSAKTYRDAKKLVLLAVSQYGKIQKEGFIDFVQGEDFDFGDFDFPDLTFDLADLSFDVSEPEPEPENHQQADEPESEGPEDPVDDFDDRPPERVKSGEVWRLGSHVLCCGDSGNADFVHRVIDHESADCIVSDPPYGLSFMGKDWDKGVPSQQLWEVWHSRLKPGAHVLSFSGTRTYHLMTVAIENAGFEIRDMMQWIYGQGFPKATDCAKQAIKEGIACGCKAQSEHEMRSVSEGNLSASINFEIESREVLQSGVSQQSASSKEFADTASVAGWEQQSSVERRAIPGTGEGVSTDSQPNASQSQSERICSGAYSGSRIHVGQAAEENGSSSSYQSRQVGQSTGKSEGVQGPQGTLDGPSFPRCPDCQRPIFPEGWKSALKPANEPICLARKPISEKTIAANVLKHGTGGLNIDASRIQYQSESDKQKNLEGLARFNSTSGNSGSFMASKEIKPNLESTALGRFPSNVILDPEAAEVLDGQSGISKSTARVGNRSGKENGRLGSFQGQENISMGHDDSGGASRFFYVAKPSKAERGKENHHATVKPVSLMQYLVRLVCQPDGLVLEPFAGSGTTLLACEKEGMNCVAFELDPKHCDIILSRWEKLTGEKAVLVTEG